MMGYTEHQQIKHFIYIILATHGFTELFKFPLLSSDSLSDENDLASFAAKPCLSNCSADHNLEGAPDFTVF